MSVAVNGRKRHTHTLLRYQRLMNQSHKTRRYIFFHFNTQSTRRSLELMQFVVSLKFISYNIILYYAKTILYTVEELNKLQLSQHLVSIFKIFPLTRGNSPQIFVIAYGV